MLCDVGFLAFMRLLTQILLKVYSYTTGRVTTIQAYTPVGRFVI